MPPPSAPRLLAVPVPGVGPLTQVGALGQQDAHKVSVLRLLPAEDTPTPASFHCYL